MTLGEMYAKTENIHEIISDFAKEIEDFENETHKNVVDIKDILENMEWSSNLADKLRDRMNNSTDKIEYSLSESEKVAGKLKEKAENYQAILEKLKKAISG